MPVEKKKKNLIEKGVKSTKSEFTKEETKWQVNVYFEKSSISLSLGDKGNEFQEIRFHIQQVGNSEESASGKGFKAVGHGVSAPLPLACPCWRTSRSVKLPVTQRSSF